MQSRIGVMVLLMMTAACGADGRGHGEAPLAPEPAPETRSAGEPHAGATVPGKEDATPPESAAAKESARYPEGRLADVAVPLAYALELTVLPEQDRFTGHTVIAVELTEPAEALFLHGRDLVMTNVVVTDADGDRYPATYEQVSPDGVAELTFDRRFEPQRVALEFDYSAPFNRALHGLYRVDEDGRSYAFTQLEAIYARQMFPSFDQPSYKTPFDVTLNVRPHHVAIANTRPVETMTLENGLKHVRFATTEPLPTYLIAIAVGELDVVQGDDIPANAIRKRAVALRGVAVHGKGAKLAHALATTAQILAPLEGYFGLPYPYDKLDILALPDFEAGAMENPGAVTFRESLLLLEDDASVKQRQRYTSVMAHELAHMWFGDLVTMPWWDDIWLNESFATWMSYKAVAAFDPGQKPEIRRLNRLRVAKREDSLISARQIREPVTDSHGIVGAFDGITYAKGGAVLNMFEHYLGEDVFREGIRLHMQRHAGGSADVRDFIASLAAVSDDALIASFESFLFQPGLPHIQVTLDCAAGQVELHQSRYLPLGSKGDRAQSWRLPVCMKYGIDGETHQQCVLLDRERLAIKLEHAACPDWLLPDANFSGYYEWSLASEEYRKLLEHDAPLSESEWLSVSDSTEAGLASGALSVADAWASMAPLAGSAHRAVAIAPTRMLRHFFEHFADDPKIAATLRSTAARLYARHDVARALDPKFMAGLERDEDRVFFAELLDFAALTARLPEIRSAALARVSETLGEDGYHAGLVSRGTLGTAFAVLAQDGDAELRERLFKAYAASRDAEFRNDALKALAAVREPAMAERVRALTLEGGTRSNEMRTLLEAHFEEPSNRPAAWRWLQEHWDTLAPKMPARDAGRAPRFLRPLCDASMAEQMRNLFEPGQDRFPGGPREIRKVHENMIICDRRVSAERPQVKALFTPGIRR